MFISDPKIRGKKKTKNNPNFDDFYEIHQPVGSYKYLHFTGAIITCAPNYLSFLFLGNQEKLVERVSNPIYPRHRKASLSYTRCSGCCLAYPYEPLTALLAVHVPSSPEATVQCNSSVGMRSQKSKILSSSLCFAVSGSFGVEPGLDFLCSLSTGQK